MARTVEEERKYRDTHREEIRNNHRKWRNTHLELQRAGVHKWQHLHPDRVRAYKRKYYYGITAKAYEQLLADQDGACAICRNKQKLLCVDHDHATGVVRGLLCRKCNAAIGLMGDDPSLLCKAANYLESHN